MNELINNIIAGVIGGMVVLLIQRFLDNVKQEKENNEKKSLINPNSKRLLTNDLITTFSPEKNYKKVKEILGEPDKTYKDFSIFEEHHQEDNTKIEYKSDLYVLENGVLKITTHDQVSINSITVFPYDNFIEIPYFEFFTSQNKINIGNAKIDEEFINYHHNKIEIRTIRESAFAIQTYTGAPHYRQLTIFTYFPNLENGIEKFIGNNIEGFCLSHDRSAFYIYEYEQR